MSDDQKKLDTLKPDSHRNLGSIFASLGLLFLLFLSIIMAPVLALLSFSTGQPARNLTRTQSVDTTTHQHQRSPFLSINNGPDPGQSKWRTLLANIPQVNNASVLTSTNYQEDRAVREAILAGSRQWEEVLQPHVTRYVASNHLQVYSGNPAQLQYTHKLKNLLDEQSERTALTARIVLGLWNSRRNDPRLSYNGQVLMRADEVLAWRGIQKHQRIAYPGATKRFSDGYQWKHKQQVVQDMELLQQYYLLGYHTLNVRGKTIRMQVDSPYLHITPLKETSLAGDVTPAYLVSPGAWINDYESYNQRYLVSIERDILELHPQNDKLALRMALYLLEYWREHARSKNYKEPVVMSHLLSASMISIDKANLTSRFVPRVEAALQKLYVQGLLEEPPVCLSCVDRTKAQWGKDWLASYWRILPNQ